MKRTKPPLPEPDVGFPEALLFVQRLQRTIAASALASALPARTPDEVIVHYRAMLERLDEAGQPLAHHTPPSPR